MSGFQEWPSSDQLWSPLIMVIFVFFLMGFQSESQSIGGDLWAQWSLPFLSIHSGSWRERSLLYTAFDSSH
jgi:hypothetical protein